VHSALLSSVVSLQGDSTVTLEQLQSLLLHPELTLVLATMIKPNLLPFVVCIVDEAYLHNGNACGQGPACIGIALIKLLHLAPHLEG
jgi:hypothetical protein